MEHALWTHVGLAPPLTTSTVVFMSEQSATVRNRTCTSKTAAAELVVVLLIPFFLSLSGSLPGVRYEGRDAASQSL